MDGARLLPRRRRRPQGAVRDRHPAAERHGLAAHGPRARHDASRTSSRAGGAWRPTTPCGCRASTTPASPRRWWSSASCARRRSKTRHDLGREEFLERVWEWRRRSGDRILEQLKLLGCSLDWERTDFTMDPAYSAAVREAFVRLYEEGLIYRAKRLINWCPSLPDGAVRSRGRDDEGTQGELYEFAYPLADGSGELVVATTRPETMLGDTAVAVHPDDPRYKAKIGKLLRHPFVNREFPVIADADPGRPEVRHRRGEGDAGPRLQRLRDRPAPQPADDLDPGRDGAVNAEGGTVRGAGPLRRAQGGEGQAEGAGARARREAARARRRSLPALRDRGRADDLDAVVREDGAAGQAGDRGGGAGEDQVRPRELDEDLLPLDAQHPGLVHLAPALVGPPHPGLVLRSAARRPSPAPRRGACPKCGGDRAQAGRGRARHLVLVRAVAVRDPRAGRTRRASSRRSTRRRCSRRATTSSSSGWPA